MERIQLCRAQSPCNRVSVFIRSGEQEGRVAHTVSEQSNEPRALPRKHRSVPDTHLKDNVRGILTSPMSQFTVARIGDIFNDE